MTRQRGYQRHPRFTKRLEATFSSGILSYRGILSNLSLNGLFIRTNRGFAPGTTIDIEVIMPDHKVSVLKGIVRRTIKTPMSSIRNGMGVELIEKDETYMNFMKSFREEPDTVTEEETPSAPYPEFQIIPCLNCGVKNKVLTEKLFLGPKCGRCGTPLAVTMP